MGIRIDVTEVRGLTSELKTASTRVGKRAAQVLAKTAFDIEADAKVLAPVDTGALMNSITTRFAGGADDGAMTAVVGTNISYAQYQEFGTSTQPGKPFLGPAFDRRVPLFQKAIAQLGDPFAG